MFAFRNKKYYICTIAHMSCELVYPSDEDIYWVALDNHFVQDIKNDSLVMLHGWIPIGDKVDEEGSKKEVTQSETETEVVLKDEEKDESQSERKGGKESEESESSRARGSSWKNNEGIMRSESVRRREVRLRDAPKRTLKKRLRDAERDIEHYKRQRKEHNAASMKEQILLLDVDVGTKAALLDKYENASRMSGSDYSKATAWLSTVLSMPFGRYKRECEGDKADRTERAERADRTERADRNYKEILKEVKGKLDESIYGMEDVKQEILEFVARRISNPKGKGHVLALCGKAGVGKTRICKALAKALSLPFHQISCGGLNDAAVLVGHSETYVGAKPGKIVEILQSSGCMNPIIYLDEVDKIGSYKGREINGILTHMLDEEQNEKFHDNYLSNVPIDISRALFVISFNDVTKVDAIVSDRMKIINVSTPTLEDKVCICSDKMIPEVLKTIKIDERYKIQMSREVVEYMAANYSDSEGGVRQLKRSIEKVLSRINYDIMVEDMEKLRLKDDTINVTVSYIRDVLGDGMKRDSLYLSMYT